MKTKFSSRLNAATFALSGSLSLSLSLALSMAMVGCLNPPPATKGPTKAGAAKTDDSEKSPTPLPTGSPSDKTEPGHENSAQPSPVSQTYPNAGGPPAPAPTPSSSPFPGSYPFPLPSPLPLPSPVPIPKPASTPSADAATIAALKAACTPDQISVVDQDAAATALFKSAFADVGSELSAIALNDCLSLYKNASEFTRVKKITINIKVFEGVANASHGANVINVSAEYIKKFSASNNAAGIKQEMLGVMTHEIGHLYQNSWADRKYGPLVEGVCDAIRAKAGLYPSNRKKKGGDYLGSYTTTGYFLMYLNEKYPDFLYKLNKAAKNWDDDFWEKTTGKTVDELWGDYQESF